MKRLTLGAATAAGYAWKTARRPVRYLPGLAGLATVSWGVAMMSVPLGVVAAGISLLLIDRKIPAARRNDRNA